MNATYLICPAARPLVQLLMPDTSPAAVPLLGQGILEYWLSHLAFTGVKRVRLLAADYPAQILALAGNGARWGLAVDVLEAPHELTRAQVLHKYEQESDAAPALDNIFVLDHFPGLAEHPLFANSADWFAALLALMPGAISADRVGMREVQPGIWVGHGARISRKAELRAPCWVGQRAFVGSNSILGPKTIVEDGAFIESGVEITNSWIGPSTFVGRLTEITRSFAWGSYLLNWHTGSCTQVPDPFLLSPLQPARKPLVPRWRGATQPNSPKAIPVSWRHLIANKGG